MNIVLRILLWPFSVVYYIVVSVRNMLYDNGILKSQEFRLPIISVGNLSIGGTGKTPHTEFIIKMLLPEFKVAMLSRGYKRKSRGFRLVNSGDSYLDSGDEPLQIKRKFPEAVVAVCNDRAEGIRRLLELHPDLNVVILDDAFQHRKITPGLSILLNNYHHPIVDDCMLPVGRLREPKHSIRRAHIVIYTKCPELKPIDRRILIKEVDPMPYQTLFFSKIKYLNPKALYDGNQHVDLNDLHLYNVLLVTGIAHINNLTNFLTNTAKGFTHIGFGDHHNFKPADIKRISQTFNDMDGHKLILFTEKDAVRLLSTDLFPDDIKPHVYYLPIEVDLICSEDERFLFEKAIINYVRNNKTYGNLYQGKC